MPSTATRKTDRTARLLPLKLYRTDRKRPALFYRRRYIKHRLRFYADEKNLSGKIIGQNGGNPENSMARK